MMTLRINKRMISTLALLLAVGTIHTQAATYYVATTGLEGNDGTTWATAVASITNGIALAASNGDIVLVSNGTYQASVQLNLTHEMTVMSANGPGVTTLSPAASAPWVGVPGILYVEVPETVLDKTVTVIALEFNQAMELYHGPGQAVETN